MLCNCLFVLLYINLTEWQNTAGYDAKEETAVFLLDRPSPISRDKMLLILPVQHKRKPADGSNEKQNLFCAHWQLVQFTDFQNV